MKRIINNVEMEINEYGHGEPIIFLHAIGVSGEIWEEQVERLSKGYRVITYDLRGHGKSEITTLDYTLELFSQDLYSIIQSFQLRKTSIVGLSIGGMVAQTFAIQYPEFVHKLILSNTTSGQTKESKRSLLNRANEVEDNGIELIVDQIISRWFTPFSLKSSIPAVKKIRGILSNTSSEGFAKSTRAIAELDLWDKLSSIQVPTLVMTGAEDPGTTIDVCKNISEKIPSSTVTIIPNASHMSPVEQPQIFTEKVYDFLNY